MTEQNSENARLARVKQTLDNAKKVSLTEEENFAFTAMNRNRDFANLGYWIAKVGERTGLTLSSGRIAHDAVGKRLLIVD